MTHKIDGPVSAARIAEAASSATARAGSQRNQPVAAAAAGDSVRLTGEAAHLQALGRQLGAAPAGVDAARVAAVQAAIADGSYRIDADAIAGRMLDLDRALAG